MATVAALVRQFEQGTVRPSDFHHSEHLQVALWYVLHYPLPEAVARMRAGLQRVLEQHHTPGAYSEETTLHWMRQVASFAVSADSSLPVEELAGELIKSHFVARQPV